MIAGIKLYLKLKPLALLAHWRHVLIGKHAKAVLTETWNGATSSYELSISF